MLGLRTRLIETYLRLPVKKSSRSLVGGRSLKKHKHNVDNAFAIQHFLRGIMAAGSPFAKSPLVRTFLSQETDTSLRPASPFLSPHHHHPFTPSVATKAGACGGCLALEETLQEANAEIECLRTELKLARHKQTVLGAEGNEQGIHLTPSNSACSASSMSSPVSLHSEPQLGPQAPTAQVQHSMALEFDQPRAEYDGLRAEHEEVLTCVEAAERLEAEIADTSAEAEIRKRADTIAENKRCAASTSTISDAPIVIS